MSVVQINLLGVPEVCRDGERRHVPMGKTLALLAYLAVEGGLHPREELVALLWPHAGEQEGRTNLRSTLNLLRKALGEQPGTSVALRTEANAVGLEPAPVLVDVQILATAAALVRQREAPPGLRSQLQGAIAAWRGPLLSTVSMPDAPDFETWLLGRRAEAHRSMGEVLAHLANLYDAAGDLGTAVGILEQLVRLDPLDELAHRRLLAAHLATGNISAGLRAYEACRAVLAAELGVEPTLETQAVAEQLQAVAHQQVVPPIRSTTDGRSVLAPPLMGRAADLVALRGRFAHAQQGQAQVVVLAGEAGIGKSRLAGEFLAWAQGQDVAVLQGQAFEQRDSVPHAALAEALRPWLERENAPDDLLDDLWLGALARLLPELCERYPDLTSAAAACTDPQLFEAVVRLIAALAHRQPLVLFLDDVQWVDGAARDLVQYAVRRWAQQDVRLLVLLAVRSEDVGTDRELAAWLEQVGRAAPTTRLTLGPLTPSATARLVASLAGIDMLDAQHHGGDTAEARFARWLAMETGGQPFFIAETLHALLEDGVLALRPDTAGGWALDVRVALRDPERLRTMVPARVEEAIKARLARLGRSAVALLFAGAALGTCFTLEQVRHIAQMSEREALDGLEEAVRAEVLREDAMGGYSFCYETIRAEVCMQTGAARRQVFWRRAQTLSQDRSKTVASSDQAAAAPRWTSGSNSDHGRHLGLAASPPSPGTVLSARQTVTYAGRCTPLQGRHPLSGPEVA